MDQRDRQRDQKRKRARGGRWNGALPHLEDIAQVLQTCPDLEFIIDGTEHPIRRPKDKAKQKNYYSGKKKRHTVKNNIVIEKSTKKVKVLSATCEGKKHDKKLADEQAVSFPKGSKLWKDTGFQRYEPRGVTTYQPMKKPKGKELTSEQKQTNQELSKQRIVVEHSIGGIKVFGIVNDVFRNFREGFDDLVMETVCGLHNARGTCACANANGTACLPAYFECTVSHMTATLFPPGKRMAALS